ncbi:PHD and RING finger domain-containing protein 1-like isoform X2 [Cyprinus carpio]|uniref:PHD and RING finger domain-containing protein 1-like isoform X2 n=1 Tax=Cyprinus carpio TaxID=7962 RepID=A0A9Q9ZSR0_CYPCA|nr:PHD and RING finger domain-containing protein 1-like isoform X2 [Cyprinus carpio]
MDEEDSQDEWINRNISHGKGKRPAMSIISDDEDISEDEGESEDGATGSEEDDDNEEEEVLDGEEEDESEDEDSGKVLEGAVGSVAVDAAGLSSDEDSEKCPICLNSFHEQPVATPESCEHYFCLDCILEWSNSANSCPVDRIVFNGILLRKCYGGKVQKTIPVKKPVKPTEEQVEVDLDQTSCEVCGGRDREDRLLLCDGCDDGYHMECLTPPLDAVPVEEWFCPMCIAHNRTSGSEQISEEESSSLPTTSRPPSRPTRAIARTQHSERVRANVNRRRITQARTAAQLAPRYMIQSTWLDETINAVVAGLNTAVYVRDLTPHSKSRRRRKTVKRRKTKSKSSATSGGKANMGVKRRKRKVRKSKSRRKLVVKKETNSRGRIARSLGIKKPNGSGSMIPSVYRPSEYSLGSMRAEIGAASLSVYGDPFDLDPFDDREDEIQVPTPSSVLDVKRRGLSHSALRSHQPVARPISAGLSRGGVSVPQVADGAEEAPVSDLLGSILSGQSMLLMDSSDVVINRDGSLKATKPVSLSLPRNTTPRGSGSGEIGDTPNSETSLIQPSGGAGPSSSPLRRPPLAHSSPWSCSSPQNSTSSPIHSPHLPHSHSSPLGHPNLLAGAPHRPVTLNPPRPGNNHLSTNGIRSQPLSRVPNGPSDSPHQDKEGPVRQPPVRKPPPKPVWVDVAVLPRIPKIKKDSTSSANSSSGSSSNTLPGSSVTSLAGNRDRTVDQQGTGASQQNRTVDPQRQREDRTGASSSFSSSFTSTTSSFSATSNSHPSSSSISFRINSSGNPWQVQRLPASGGTLPGGEVEAIKKKNKSKQMLLSLRAKAKEEKSEVYDPFNPTGSDSSDNEPENEGPEISIQNSAPRVPIGFNENVCHQIKSEPLDVHSDTERGLEMCAEVKTEPDCLWDRPCEESPHHSDTMHSQALDSTSCEEGMDTGSGGTPGSPFQKTEEHSRSSWSCSEINVKVEVKSEPETGTLPIRPQSKSLEESLANLQQASKENGVCKELPSVSGAFNSSNTAKHKEERPHQSQSKDRKRSPSNSQSLSSKDSHKKTHSKLKEKRRSRSRSRDRQRSRSKSKERQRSRSRSKERRCPRTRDRRCSSSSSSRERKTSGRRASHERNDNRGRERPRKRSKERRCSRSRSLSRSRERRRTSKLQGETKLKRQRSRSTSRERKRREERSEISQRTERSSYKSAEPMSTESHEPALRANKNTMPVKTEQDARPQKCETTVALPSVKQETQSVEITAHGLGSSRHEDLTRTLQESEDDVSLELLKPNEIKQEELCPTGSVKEFKDIKKEEDVCLNWYGELDGVKKMKKEDMTSLDIFSWESPCVDETESGNADLEKSHASLQDEIKVQEMVVEPKKMITEKIWPDEDDSPSCSDNPLVINLDTPAIDAMNCKKEPTESYQSPPLEEDMEMSPLQPPDPPIKQELGMSSDEDISVDYLIDNLDFIKKEMSESSVADSTEAVNPKSAIPETSAWNKQTTEMVTSGAKSKSQGKRVTWNLQEPAEPQSEKLSKLALFKLKLKQEGSRRSTTTPQNQAEPKLMASVSSLPPQDESKPKSRKEVLQDPNQKDMYMKKLHMQERAIEEVKLAIKPFYQKRDITKEEYKEILRKAVQKVCHSKSGEINPVKVANLVKAYVDMFKHAKKHKKEETVQSQHTDSQTPM